MISFSDYRFTFARHTLARPFHFKGGFFTEKWINVVRLQGSGNDAGAGPTGIGGNAVLWSDERVSSAWSETGGNTLMTLVAERAVQMARGSEFPNPISAFLALKEGVHEYACTVTGRRNLSPTFSLNAMVALDFALWKAYSREQKSQSLGFLIGSEHQEGIRESSSPTLRVPLLPYNVPIEEVERLVRAGHRVLKIKLGQGSSREEMLRLDSGRLEELHRVITRHSDSVLYYLDANGRYPDLESVNRLLEHADKLGALERIILLEEPFAYERKIDVGSLPVRVAADESLHDVADLEERLELGYKALALKPAGKTLSLSILMAARAAENGVSCFVADSACVPSLLQWNLAFAALLPPFPNLGARLIESNGAQNYTDWDEMVGEHNTDSQRWMIPIQGEFTLDDQFLASSGGVFTDVDRYESLLG